MSEKEKRILDTFEKIMPDLTELDKEKLLAFGEGIAFKINQQQMQKQLNQEYKDGKVTQDQYRDANNRLQRELSAVNVKIEEQERALKKCNPQIEAASAKLGDFGEKATAAGERVNNLIDRTYKLEEKVEVLNEKIDVANHRIKDLEEIK